MKYSKILALIVTAGLIIGLVGCGDKNVDTGDTSANQTQSGETNNHTTEIPVPIQNVIKSVGDASVNNLELLSHVVDYNDDNVVEALHYHSTLLNESMKNNDTYKILTQPGKVIVESGKKASKNEWFVDISNEAGDIATFNIVKVDDNWKLNIHGLISTVDIKLPHNCKTEVLLNGIALDTALLNKEKSTDEYDIYTVQGILSGVDNKIEYKLPIGIVYKGSFKTSDTDIDLRYINITEDIFEDVESGLTQLIDTFFVEAYSGRTENIQSLFIDKDIDFESIAKIYRDKQYSIVDIQFTDTDKQLITDYNIIKFEIECDIENNETSEVYKNACWVEIYTQSDDPNEFKIAGCSEEVWMTCVDETQLLEDTSSNNTEDIEDETDITTDSEGETDEIHN